MKSCLYGSKAKKENIIAYCTYHHSYLTINQLKTKECLKLNCSRLIKYTQKEYWKKRELIKLKKKEKSKRDIII